ncbi:MAG: hypothetical protein JST68_17350 [Bacteroidetes bacterium]|nr:hypothetical protein [Bacteroidota bacterium]
MKQLLILTFLLSYYTAIAQVQLFQDAKGESALRLFGNSVSVNTKDQSISFSAGKYYNSISRPEYDIDHRWSGTLELKANEGITNLKDGNNYLIDGSIGVYYGWKKSSAYAMPGRTRERFMAASIGDDRNKLFNNSLPKKDVVYSRGQLVYKLEAGQFGYIGDLLYGISTSYKQQTNINEIQTKSVSYLENDVSNDSILIYKEKQAYDIKEFIGSQHVLSINADAALLINSSQVVSPGNTPPAFLAFHFRYQYIEGRNGEFNPAIGFYLGRHSDPRTIIGGFNIQFMDVFNAKAQNTNAWERSSINFVVGFKL